MKTEIKIPSVGESVQEAVLVEWYKQNGEAVKKDEPLFLIETDKVTLEVNAETGGILEIAVAAGETVAVGAVVGFIDTEGKPAEGPKAPEAPEKRPAKREEKAAAAEKKAAPEKIEPAAAKETRAERPSARPQPEEKEQIRPARDKAPVLSPAVRRLAVENEIDIAAIAGTGPAGRITKGDVLLYLERRTAAPAPGSTGEKRSEAKPAEEKAPAEKAAAKSPAAPELKTPAFGRTTRKPMSPIRRRIAERLLQARQQTAMLTTFNEIDMGRMMEIRAAHKEEFRKKFDASLGLMSFFIKATVSALQAFPEINAFIEGTDIVYHDYYHIGVAVGSERGLVVPVIRDADRLDFARLEKSIVDFVERINTNRLTLEDLEGGTFTISNGGVYGSLLSTPILNLPQSGILGMHKIEKRPVAADDRVVIRPMMYVALSYDHRIVDGREAVSFLKHIKEWIEDPPDPFQEATA